jgi:hypothetical protein
MWVGWHVYKWTVVSVSHQNQDNICDWGDMSTSGHTVKIQLRWYHTLQVEFDLLVLFFLFFLAVCLNISTVINIKILTNSNQQTRSYKFTSHIAAFLSVVLITEMVEICIQTSYDQNVQLILKSYLPVVYGTTLKCRYLI